MGDITIDNKVKIKIETEVKLHINQKLFDDKVITEEMYLKAKEILISNCNRTS